MDSSLTERQNPSTFQAVRSSGRNARQPPKSQKACHEEIEQETDPEQHQETAPRLVGRAYVSQPSSPIADEYSSPDLETTAPFRAVKNGDIGQGYERKRTEVVNELERPSWGLWP